MPIFVVKIPATVNYRIEAKDANEAVKLAYESDLDAAECVDEMEIPTMPPEVEDEDGNRLTYL